MLSPRSCGYGNQIKLKGGVDMKSYIFLCSPSLGILDNWLPVIWNLKARDPNARFTIVFTRQRTPLELNQNLVLYKIAQDCFDEVVFKKSISFSKADSVFGAMHKAKNQRIYNWFYEICRRVSILKRILIWVDEIMSLKYLEKWIELTVASSESIYLLVDIYEESKSYNHIFLSKTSDFPRFSIHHGVNILNGGVIPTNVIGYNIPEAERRKVFLFSNLDRKIWQLQYGLDDVNMYTLGIAKHDKTWIRYIQTRSNFDKNSLPKKFIGLIGRPISSYLPKDRKIKAIKDLLKSAEKYDLPIVVKRHPKEHLDGTYEEVFGVKDLGIKWHLSDAHWFELAEGCVFAMAFFSSVPVDLIIFGVPVIEYLNLKGLPGFDTQDSLRDDEGNPVFSYRYLGLVYGADNTNQFNHLINRIILDRNGMAEKLNWKYKEIFYCTEDAINKITNSILELP